MASISSNGTGGGLASLGASWSGGVVPVEGDKVTVLSGDTITVDGTYTWGDDTAATSVSTTAFTGGAIVVSGTLSASRSVNSSLTCKGDICISATGTLDYGTAASPIPSGVTATMLLNKAATPASVKYGLITINGSQWYSYGAGPKTVNATLTSTASAGATSISVDDVTGWANGDRLILHSTSSNPASYDERTINGSITGSGPYSVPLSSALTSQHLSGCRVGNFTHNVKFASYAASTPGYNAQMCSTTQSANTRIARYTLFENLGDSTSGSPYKWSGWAINNQSTSAYTTNPYTVSDCSFYTMNNAVSSGVTANLNYVRSSFTDLAITNNTTRSAIYLASGSVLDFTRTVVYRGTQGCYTGYSQGGVSCRFYNCGFYGVINCVTGNGHGLEYFNCDFGASVYLATTNAITGMVFDTCTIGTIFPISTTYSGLSLMQSTGSIWTATFTDCQFQSHPLIYTAGTGNRIQDAASTTKLTLLNKNGDVTAQEIYKTNGTIYRDNSVVSRSTSSFRLEPYQSAPSGALTHEFRVPAQDGVEITLKVRMRKNSSYGSATRPSVTISGLGITPVVATLTDSTNTWEDFTLQATQNSGADGELTVTLTAQSANSGAVCFFDGLPNPPFITKARHYGYLFNETNPLVTVDPIITDDETTISALSGITMTGNEISITGSISIQELYDWCKYQAVLDLSLADFMTSVDGVNFLLDRDLDISGDLTGTGNLSIGSNTLTFTGTSEIDIAHGAGVLTAISASGYTVGARIQLYDVTDDSEIYNDIPAAEPLRLNYDWATGTDKTIRCRMARVDGTDADKLIEQSGTFSSSGLGFLLVPEADTIYEGNAIDGDTVTEFTADYPNVQIDVNDPDGTTTPQRGYAWYMAGQMTADGIRYYHGGMVAEDAYNYRIEVPITDMRVQNVSVNPAIITGARLYRSDGTSIFATGNGPIQAEPDKAYIANIEAIEPGIDLAAATRIMLAALAGKRVGIGTATEQYMAQDGVTPRVTFTPSDVNGNGTTVVDGT